MTAMAAGDDSVPITDMIPVVSQIKYGFQHAFGDKDGAARTHANFMNQGLGPSQVKSIQHLIAGDPDRALEVQKKFVANLEPLVDGLPVVGHIKGVVHLVGGDAEHGWAAIRSATSSTGAVIGGVLGGPLGAVGGHALTDAAITGVQSTIAREWKPHGIVDYVANIDRFSPGDHFDTVATLGLDAYGGKVAKQKHVKHNNRVGHGEPQRAPDGVGLLGPRPARPETELKLENILENAKRFEDSVRHRRTGYDEVENTRKRDSFRKFQDEDPFYNRGLDGFERNIFMNGGELLEYGQPSALDKLDIKALTDKLTYLNADIKTLISKNDFKTVNTLSKEKFCLGCSLAAIIKTDLGTLHNTFRELFESKYATHPQVFVEDIKNTGLIDFTSSGFLNNMEQLNTYLKTHATRLENKDLLLCMIAPNSQGHAVVLKFKMINDYPQILTIDYQKPGLLLPDVPNPERFHTFIDRDMYERYIIYTIIKK